MDVACYHSMTTSMYGMNCTAERCKFCRGFPDNQKTWTRWLSETPSLAWWRLERSWAIATQSTSSVRWHSVLRVNKLVVTVSDRKVVSVSVTGKLNC